MLTMSGFAETAALVGDPARANMLLALMDGRALTATELAQAAGVTPQTASVHLARMTEARLLTVERQGRHRYHRLASATVARMLEGIMAAAAASQGRRNARVRTGPRDQAMRRARSCYDHLAGRIAVAIADRMVEHGHVELSPDAGALSENGAAFLREIGVDPGVPPMRAQRRLVCRPCLDWSERRPHIAGAVGSALLNRCVAAGWMLRNDGSRILNVTPAGRAALDRHFALDAALWDSDAR